MTSVAPRSIDDVPVMALTLSGAKYDDVQVRQFAAQLDDVLKELPMEFAVEAQKLLGVSLEGSVG